MIERTIIVRKSLLLLARVMVLLVLAVLYSLPRNALAQSGSPQVAWTSAMAEGDNGTASNFTCRWIVRPSIGGTTIRVHLSNLYGGTSETFNAATVALRTSGAAVSNITPLTFGGQRSVAIPANAQVTSDPVTFTVAAQQDLAVSLYYAGANPTRTANPSVTRTSYCTDLGGGAGDHTNDASASAFTNSAAVMWWVNAVDVYNSPMTGAIVAFGASITDGVGSTTDGNNSWVDVLSSRLLQIPNPKSVVNEGISGDGACSNGS